MLAAARAARSTPWSMVKPQFEVGRERVGKGGVVRDPALRREALVAVGEGRDAASAPRCWASPRRGCPGPRATSRPSPGWPRASRPGARRRPRGGGRRRWPPDAHRHRAHPPPRRRHRRGPRRPRRPPPRRAGRDAALRRGGDPQARPAPRAPAWRRRAAVRRRRPLHRDGRRRHDPQRPARVRGHRRARLRGQLRRGRLPRHARPRRPGGRLRPGLRRATSRRSRCPASASGGRTRAGSRSTTSPCTASRACAWPTSPTRSPARRSAACAATGSWSSTPQGSTGYNLANGGPVLAWGVEGFVVSFIAPHSLTARALVVGARRPADDQQREPRGAGRAARGRAPGRGGARGGGHPRGVRARAGLLAQLPGASFYHRLRERFGRLAR